MTKLCCFYLWQPRSFEFWRCQKYNQ